MTLPGGPFAHAGPRWFTIAAHRPFVEDLARGLHETLSPLGPDALSQALVLTPTRRGARALAEAFVSAGGGQALLLPQIRAIGDLEEGEPPFEPGDLALDLPPAISGYRRRFELARLVAQNDHHFERSIDAAGALELADALAGFLDSCQIEEIGDLSKVETLVEGDMARHWQRSADFLRLATDLWPRRLAELGLADVTDRRVALLRALAGQWTENPPQGVLVAAGSTGTAPATADLLAVIARAPLGAVVLPGLDLDLADEAWMRVGEQHPQGTMKRLLIRAEVSRDDVRPWPVSGGAGEARGRWRRRLINEALRPAESTADWRDQILKIRQEAAAGAADPIAEGLGGLVLMPGRSSEETAVLAALLMRETLETPDRTCALVTPDRDLARRVTARLARWGIAPDSSAGAPLSGCGVGVLAALVARATVDAADPVRLLAILKHPAVRLRFAYDVLEAHIDALERHGLRGARRDGWAGLFAHLQTARRAEEAAGAAELAQGLRTALDHAAAPYAHGDAPVAEAARALAEAMEMLATGPDGDLGDLWTGSPGDAAAGLFSALIEESDGLPPATPAGFAALLEGLMEGATVRTGGSTHPRLRILGAIEARLVRADRVILAGLEEGVWPAPAPTDPFLSRPMRRTLGLPPPERRIGLSAHDFAQAACAPEVYLLHSERREGAPAVESRWLWRLKTLARGAKVDLPRRDELLDWARGLDAAGQYDPAPRPAPTPPRAARPTKFAVTRIEALTRDPYAVYARDILKLFPLDRPDEPMEARARGTAIHQAFEDFAVAWPKALPADPAAEFARLYLQALRDAGAPASAMARETALAREAAAWVAEVEARRRAGGVELLIEQQGSTTIQAGATTFTITAKADRIELTPDGHAHVVDYKTGAAPSQKMVETGFSPQLTLTAAILGRGGFEGAGTPEPGDLVYLRVTGRKPAGEEVVRGTAGAESIDLSEQAWAGLQDLLARFDDPAYPYRSRTAPQFVKQYPGDYDHLARVYEWSTSGQDEEGGE